MSTEQNALLKWMSDNPEATNMGMGFLKSLQEEQRNRGRAGAEIAKTQYGYLLGQGPGDISKAQGPGMLDRLAQGYITGRATRQGDDMNAKVMDLLSAKASKDRAGAYSDIRKLEPVSQEPNPYSGMAAQKQTPQDVSYVKDDRGLDTAQDIIDKMIINAAQPGAYRQIDGSGKISDLAKKAQLYKQSRYPAGTGGY